MEIHNASTKPSTSNQLRNVNTVRWESRKITTQPGEIYDRNFEVIPYVVKAGLSITANLYHGKKSLCLKYLLCSTEVPFDIHQEYFSEIQGYRW